MLPPLTVALLAGWRGDFVYRVHSWDKFSAWLTWPHEAFLEDGFSTCGHGLHPGPAGVAGLSQSAFRAVRAGPLAGPLRRPARGADGADLLATLADWNALDAALETARRMLAGMGAYALAFKLPLSGAALLELALAIRDRVARPAVAVLVAWLAAYAVGLLVTYTNLH